MPTIEDIPAAWPLYNEYTQIEAALDTLNTGGQIISIAIGQPGAVTGMNVPMTEPPPEEAMEWVKDQLKERQTQIESQLSDMGFSGSLR